MFQCSSLAKKKKKDQLLHRVRENVTRYKRFFSIQPINDKDIH